jgi:hypothetical protein
LSDTRTSSTSAAIGRDGDDPASSPTITSAALVGAMAAAVSAASTG